MRPPAAALTALAVLAALVATAPPAAAETPVVAISVERDAFSPNGDRVADAVIASVTTDVAGALTLEVLDAASQAIATLIAGAPIPAGKTTAEWTGQDDADHVVPDGTYAIRATVIDAEAGSASAQASVVVDTVPPDVRWRRISPEPVEQAHGTVTFAFDAAGAARGSLSVTDASGQVVHRDTWEELGGLVERPWNLRSPRGERVPPGPYTVRVRVADAAGNVASGEPRILRDVHPVAARVVTSVRGSGRRVALTFDDCNSATAWGRILTALERAHVHGTFFCPGQRVLALPGLARSTVREGHTVGAHGWDHADMTTLGPEEIRDRLERDEAAWWRTTGAMAVPFFRPPYGALDAEVREVAGAAGYAWIALWNVDPRDWELPGPSAIAARVLSHVHAGSIVVMHVNTQTAQALPAILRALRARGLRQVSLAELVASGSVAMPGRVARMPV